MIASSAFLFPAEGRLRFLYILCLGSFRRFTQIKGDTVSFFHRFKIMVWEFITMAEYIFPIRFRNEAVPFLLIEFFDLAFHRTKVKK